MDKNLKIIGTGLSGLVGSRVVQLLSSQFEFEELGTNTGIDITDEVSVKECISASSAPIILHMAAKTNVDRCEDDKGLGEEGEAWRVNVIGTENIVEAARQTGKKVIYISTDFVFDGSKKEAFTEKDEPNPVNWYGETKYQGEKVLKNGDIEYTIIRIASPYCNVNIGKKDFVHRIMEKLQNGEKITAVTDHFFTPTHIDDIALGLSLLLRRNFNGIYHLSGSEILTPIDAAVKIADVINVKKGLIIPISRDVYFKDRAFRPRNLALKSDKIAKFNLEMRSFAKGIKECKKL